MAAERRLRYIPTLLGLGLLVAALWSLRRELAHVSLASILAELRALPTPRIAAALGATVASYGLLTLYDVLGLRRIGRPMPYARAASASFASYVTSHNVGLGGLAGFAVRYRLYSQWSLSLGEVVQVFAFASFAYWLGFLLALGLVLASGAGEALHLAPPLDLSWRDLAVLPLGASVVLAFAARWRRTPRTFRGIELCLPSPAEALRLAPLAVLDWAAAASVAWVLLPGGTSFPTFLAAFLLAQMVASASHVPAGLGVLESSLILLLPEEVPRPALIGALIAYRGVYYLLPLLAGTALLTGLELPRWAPRLAGLRGALQPALRSALPAAFALGTAATGVLLILLGGLPLHLTASRAQLERIPLPLIELSHLAASVAGIALLVLARGLQRRVDLARVLALVATALGALFLALRGMWPLALVLCLCPGIPLLTARDAFHRRSAILQGRLHASSIGALAAALACFAWIGLYAHRHIEYSHELWWRFALDADAPRFLRAVLVIALGLFVAGALRLLSPSAPPPTSPTPAELERALPAISNSTSTHAWLALTGDKPLLFDDSGQGFVMFGVQGGRWIAMGDPVGPAEVRRELVWRFVDLAERSGARVAFYQVGPEDLAAYAEAGLLLVKIGEEARVALEGFTLDAPELRHLRRDAHRAEREGASFELVAPEAVPALLPALAKVSDAWLAMHRARGEGFSLGFFQPAYLARCSVAVVRVAGEPCAFANVWLGARGEELSIDLMRHAPDAPPGTMDFLFCRLMSWGREHGYRWFNLGLAPLSGVGERASAPLWERAAALVFRLGEPLYNFRGIRAYKEKFAPTWRPRFLAMRSLREAPATLARVSTLVARGARGLVGR